MASETPGKKSLMQARGVLAELDEWFTIDARCVVIARALEATRAEGRREALAPEAAATMGMDRPWPLVDVLARLADAADHLRDHHSCDTHGYELTLEAARLARVYLAELRANYPRHSPHHSPHPPAHDPQPDGVVGGGDFNQTATEDPKP